VTIAGGAATRRGAVDGIVALPQADSLFHGSARRSEHKPQRATDNVLLLPTSSGTRCSTRCGSARTRPHADPRRALAQLPPDPAAAYTAVSERRQHRRRGAAQERTALSVCGVARARSRRASCTTCRRRPCEPRGCAPSRRPRCTRRPDRAGVGASARRGSALWRVRAASGSGSNTACHAVGQQQDVVRWRAGLCSDRRADPLEQRIAWGSATIPSPAPRRVAAPPCRSSPSPRARVQVGGGLLGHQHPGRGALQAADSRRGTRAVVRRQASTAAGPCLGAGGPSPVLVTASPCLWRTRPAARQGCPPLCGSPRAARRGIRRPAAVPASPPQRSGGPVGHRGAGCARKEPRLPSMPRRPRCRCIEQQPSAPARSRPDKPTRRHGRSFG